MPSAKFYNFSSLSFLTKNMHSAPFPLATLCKHEASSSEGSPRWLWAYVFTDEVPYVASWLQGWPWPGRQSDQDDLDYSSFPSLSCHGQEAASVQGPWPLSSPTSGKMRSVHTSHEKGPDSCWKSEVTKCTSKVFTQLPPPRLRLTVFWVLYFVPLCFFYFEDSTLKRYSVIIIRKLRTTSRNFS